MTWAAYDNEFADRPNAGGTTPVPLRLSACGLPAPDDVIVRAPLRVPATVGEKVTVTVQVLFCARVAVQVVVRPKSPVAADMDIPLMAPLFAVSVIDCPTLVLPVF